VARGWKRLHNEEPHNFYDSPSVIRVIKSRRMRWARHVARMDAMRNAYNIFVRKPEGRRPLARLKCRWEDNIRKNIREIGREVRD